MINLIKNIIFEHFKIIPASIYEWPVWPSGSPDNWIAYLYCAYKRQDLDIIKVGIDITLENNIVSINTIYYNVNNNAFTIIAKATNLNLSDNNSTHKILIDFHSRLLSLTQSIKESQIVEKLFDIDASLAYYKFLTTML